MNAPVYDPLWSAFPDRYIVGEEVGRGGMATVFLARDVWVIEGFDRDVGGGSRP